MGKAFDKADKEDGLGIHGNKGLLFSYPSCASVIHPSYLEQQYMLEMVEARRDGDKVEERYDLFSGLLDATQDEPGSEMALSNEELFGGYWISIRLGSFGSILYILTGNMFVFLLAGHEVRFLLFLRCCSNRFPTDHSAYTMLLVGHVGSLSWRARVSISTHQRCYVRPE